MHKIKQENLDGCPSSYRRYLRCLAFYMTTGVEAQQGAPRYVFDPTWPKALPNNWKMGGVTGLAVDKDDNVWVLTRPNDTTEQEDNAATNPPTAHCCVKPPTMIHISKTGEVIGSFDAPQGHGMDVDSQGFVYIGQDTVRKYEPEVRQDGQGTAARPRKHSRRAAVDAGAATSIPPSRPRRWQRSARSIRRRPRRSSDRSKRSASMKKRARCTSPTAISAVA